MPLQRHRHPASRRRKLNKAGLSEESELDTATCEALDAASLDMSARSLREICQGKVHAPKRASESDPDAKPTLISEALRILGDRGAMHYKDLTDAIVAEGRVEVKGKTPAQTLSAALGRRDDTERVAPGVFALKEDK